MLILESDLGPRVNDVTEAACRTAHSLKGSAAALGYAIVLLGRR